MPKRSLQEWPPQHDIVAAVDLGSNSFHMTIAKVIDGGLLTIGRLKERVQLAAGLYEDDVLSDEAIMRGVSCLQMFGQRLKGMPPTAVRAVGTNTLRKAKNASTFLQLGSQALGFPIEVIAGKEEARLIYAGVAHTTAEKERRLIIDIGGGSTEIIVGTGFNPEILSSLQMGCVAFAGKFFEDGQISKSRFKEAQTQCYLELQTIEQQYRHIGWKTSIGSSGTIVCISDVLRALGHEDGVISLSRLYQLRDVVLTAKNASELSLPGLTEDRRNIFAPGLAVLLACFEILGIIEMRATDAALREGLLYELVGRFTDMDVRERSIWGLVTRHQLDKPQAELVRETCEDFYQRVAESWALEDPELHAILNWSALVHEIGLVISYGQMHKHGAYILSHSDIDGFSQQEKALLAILVRVHRRKFAVEEFNKLPKNLREKAKRLARLLRLSVLLHHRRTPDPLPEIDIDVFQDDMQLHFPEGWLEEHSLVRADLEQEQHYLNMVGFNLSWD